MLLWGHGIYHQDHSAGGHYYCFFMAWFLGSCSEVAMMVDHMSEGRPVFAGLILTAMALFAVLNLGKYTLL